MHLLTFDQILDMGALGNFLPGEYLMENRNAAEIMFAHPEMKFDMVPYATPRGFRVGTEVSNYDGKILIIALIGFGDGLMLTPVLRQLRVQFPNATLRLACWPEHRQVFLGLPYLDGFEDYPVLSKKLKDYGPVISLEGAVEYNARAREQHMTHRFAEHIGMGAITDPKPEYNVQPAEREWVFATYPKPTGKKRLGLQVQAGVRSRTPPSKLLSAVCRLMVERDWEVCLLGRPGEFSAPEHAGIVNITTDGLTFRQSVAFLLTCDAFLGPDSSLLHAAGTLDIPSVGLFGPFPWKLRTAYYPSVFVIQGTEGCEMAPCFHPSTPGGMSFPKDGPCAKTGFCLPLGNIAPFRIVNKLESIAETSAPIPAGAGLS